MSRASYFAALDTLEVFKLPKHPETAARWRAEAPKDFVFSVVADLAVGRSGFRPGRGLDESWERTTAIARALKASFIVIETPQVFYPQADRLRDFYAFARAADRAGAVLVWQPTGAWEPKLVGRICADLRLVHAVDPLVRSPVAGAVNYFRLRGGGPGRKPSRGHRYFDKELQSIIHLAGGKPTYAFFLNADSWDNARQLAKMVSPMVSFAPNPRRGRE